MGTATSAMVAWLLTAMMAWSPVGRKHFIVEAVETEEEGRARYTAIAEAVVRVAYDPNNSPIILAKQDHSRASSALLITSIAFFESGFRKDVDFGVGKYGVGDNGNAHCMMQLELGKNRTSTDLLQKIIGRSWSVNDVVTDREKCFTAGYLMVSRSFTSCRSLPLEERLAVYASGSCEDGREKSVLRVRKARRWYSGHLPPVSDKEVMQELHPNLPVAVGMR